MRGREILADEELRLRGPVRITALSDRDFIGEYRNVDMEFLIPPRLRTTFESFRRRQVIRINAIAQRGLEGSLAWEVLNVWRYDQGGNPIDARSRKTVFCERGLERRGYVTTAEAARDHGYTPATVRTHVKRGTHDRHGWRWWRE